jgi:hypothetical protein
MKLRSTNKCILALQFLYVFRCQLYVLESSSDGGISGQNHVVSGIVKTFVCLMITTPFLFVVNYIEACTLYWKRRGRKEVG